MRNCEVAFGKGCSEARIAREELQGRALQILLRVAIEQGRDGKASGIEFHPKEGRGRGRLSMGERQYGSPIKPRPPCPEAPSLCGSSRWRMMIQMRQRHGHVFPKTSL